MKRLEYLECGRMINTHGVKGVLKVESWCDSPSVLACLEHIYIKEKRTYKEYDVLHSSLQKSFVLMSIRGIDTVEDAIPLKGTVIYAARDDLAPNVSAEESQGVYFVAEMIGTRIVDADTGKEYGTLKDITNLGASDIYIIDTPSGEVMMPAVDEFVKKIDADNDIILVTPIPGIFE